ncbi:hypothetical protein WICMUC_004667 [Wickerhamomyces mucosus]|uniref:Protein arginine methyltransferase NDUFAF7 n=1 Tax=Wickerhamomyces mucosus TaxID=1378264 RepID=A0A9P8PGT8_9ASCO|nr:hypothetical protein WICMUC_004667 [Wickerhamomyces mucosus]
MGNGLISRRSLSSFSKLLSEKKQRFIHDYSVTPTTFNYRLPSKITSDKFYSAYNKNSIFYSLFHYLSPQSLNKQTPRDFYDSFPLTNFKQLSKSKSNIPPKNVKMLTRDFIDDSLYNPQYGYFNKNAEIFSLGESFDYNNINDIDEFIRIWSTKYEKYSTKSKDNLQLWHTPSELFQPFYGEALARYILVNYKLNLYPYDDLVIYEIGGGNGTLMKNILQYIARNEPKIYKRTKYKIIEISKPLSMKQRFKHLMIKDLEHRVEIVNKSFLDWDERQNEHCFVIGMEVLDNLSHDVLKYDLFTGEPYQGYVVIDENGDFHQFWDPELNAETKTYLELTKDIGVNHEYVNYLTNALYPLNKFNLLKQKFNNVFSPFQNDLTNAMFIPTNLIKIFKILKEKFPNHQLLISDFNKLPKSINRTDYNHPIVQIFLNDKFVTSSTYLAKQGEFDIIFPTDFEIIQQLYTRITGKLISVSSHEKFMNDWSDVEGTCLANGENPLLSLYSNASFLHS